MSDDRNPPAVDNEVILRVGIAGFEETMERLQALDAILESIAERCERIDGTDYITVNNYTFNAATGIEATIGAQALADE